MNEERTTALQIGADVQFIDARDVEKLTETLARWIHWYEDEWPDGAASARQIARAFIRSLQISRTPMVGDIGDMLLSYGFAAGYAAGRAAAAVDEARSEGS